MNSRILSLVSLTLVAAPLLPAQTIRDPHAPVPVNRAPPSQDDKSLLTPPAGENQRVYGPTRSTLVDPAVAQDVSKRFRAAYVGAENGPRVVIYVNRPLVENQGLQLTGRTEKFYESTSTNKTESGGATTTSDVSGENTYRAGEEAKPTLADQQTVREIERLFGRVLRHAGAQLADQKVAASLLAEQSGMRLGSREAAKEREALKQVADIAIEVLVASRSITARGVAGDRTYEVPDIQATAIRLSDAAVLGQAAATDVLGPGALAGESVRQFGVPDITEATAFALLQDMLTGKP